MLPEAWYWNPRRLEWIPVSFHAARAFRMLGYCTARRKAL